MSKGGSTQTVTQKSDPWKPAQQSLKDILGQGQQLYNQGSEYAPFSTVVPFSDQTLQGLQGIQDKASGPNAIADSSSSTLQSLLSGNPYLTGTANGDFLNSNPYLDQMFGNAAGQVRNQVNSNFSMSGRTDSGAHQDTLQRGLNDLATNIYGGNYAQERQNMLSAGSTIGSQQLQGLGQAGDINSLGYSDLSKLLGVGQAYEGQAGNQLQDLMNRWQYGQDQPWANLQRYQGLASGIGGAGGTQTQSTPSGGSDLASMLGSVASIASMIPW